MSLSFSELTEYIRTSTLFFSSSSSWYDVDYSVASPLRFGQCLGCDFAEKSCFSYG